MKKKRLLPLGILAILVLATLIYTRPMTLQQIGKVDIAQCESISGYHLRCPEVEDTYFELSADDERFSQLAGLLRGRNSAALCSAFCRRAARCGKRRMATSGGRSVSTSA